MAKTDWIQGAIKHPGAFTKKAKAAGMTPLQFAKKPHSGVTGKQAALMLTLKSFNKKKGSK